MYLYIKFYINNKENDKHFLFWSCALDTVCTNIDYDYLNKGSEYILQEFDNLSISEKFNELSFAEIDSDKSYQRRNPVFLPKDDSFETGSPYKGCCCDLINYYKSPGAFASDLKDFFSGLSDFEILARQKAAIAIIKDLVGFDLAKTGSYPGCISVFEPLSHFFVSSDLRQKRIRIRSKDHIANFIAEIEGLSVENSIKSKTVFKRLYFRKARMS